MFGYKHYLPILKTKNGEFWAVKHLRSTAKAGITPLFELDNLPRPKTPKKPPKKPTKPKTLGDHLKKKMVSIADCWGVGNKFFLDTIWIRGQDVDPSIASSVFDSARLAGLHAIPVASLSHSNSVLNEIGAIAAKDKRGAMLRLGTDDINRPHLIDAVLKQLTLQPKQVHLLLDYHTKPMSLDADISTIPHLMNWHTLSASSSAFPASLASLPHRTWHELPRTEWKEWSKSIKGGKLKRMPAFADNTVRAYGAPAEGGKPPVVLRYTCPSKWLVRQDGNHMDGDSPEMLKICQSLVKRPEFLAFTASYSEGDKAIQGIADGKVSTGAPQQWVQYAVNHHIEVVVRENLPSV